MNNNWLTPLWSLFTMSLAVMFGVQGKPTEMGIIVVAGAIILSFLNIDKIQRFKGAGFEAEMKKAVEDANATIEQLRQVASMSSEAILTSLMADNFMSGTTLATRLKLHDQIIESLKEIGASGSQIDCANQMWKKGACVLFHRGIRNLLAERNKLNNSNSGATNELRAAIGEIDGLLKFEEWQAPTSDEIRQFIENKSLMNEEISKLLLDYKEFETKGTLRRKDVFVTL